MSDIDFDEEWLSPASRAFDGAGPPDGRLFAGLAAGIAAAATISTVSPTTGPFWAVVALTTAVSTGVVALADRDAWRIRNGLAFVSIGQRARWGRGAIPETRDQAAAWLEDPANADASALERASVLMHLDRYPEAADLLDRHQPTAAEAAWQVRVRGLIEGRTTGRIDMGAVREAVRTLEPAEARYQLVAAAWAQAWLDLIAGRGWRKGFADAIRELGPLDVPGRTRFWMAVWQLAAPITCLALLPIVALILAVFPSM